MQRRFGFDFMIPHLRLDALSPEAFATRQRKCCYAIAVDGVLDRGWVGDNAAALSLHRPRG